MGRTIRNYSDGGLKVMKTKKPRNKHVRVEDFIDDDEEYIDDISNKDFGNDVDSQEDND